MQQPDIESAVCYLLEQQYPEQYCHEYNQSKLADAFQTINLAIDGARPSKDAVNRLEIDFRKLCLTHAEHINVIITFLDLSIYLSGTEWADESLPYTLLADLFECQNIQRCQQLFSYLASRIHLISKDISPSRGKGLIFLRMLNDLHKRLSPCSNAAFAGEIQSLIALVFPLTARSGVNLKGEYNLDNVTRFEAAELLVSASSSGLPESASSVEEELMGEKITLADVMDGKSTMRFYACFWSLQDYFRNPLTLLSKDDFIQFKRRLQISLAVFKELYAQDNRPHSNSSSILPPAVTAMQSTKDSNYVPKYLTSSNLFRLQLSDLTFRRSFLLQSLVILRFLQQSFASRKSIETTATTAVAEDWRTEELPWLHETSSTILNVLERSKPHGFSFVNSVNCILEMENHWTKWKMASCPAFEREPVPLDSVINVPEDRQFQPDCFMGSRELQKLWGDATSESSELSLNDKCLNVPSLVEYLGPLIEQMNPEDQIEMEYRLSNDAVYTWKGLRLAAKHNLDTFQKLPNEDFEQFVVGLKQTGFDELSDAERADLAVRLIRTLQLSSLQSVYERIQSALRRDFIKELPHELAIHILSMLDPNTLGSAARVSKQWNKLVMDDQLWHRLYLSRQPFWTINAELLETDTTAENTLTLMNGRKLSKSWWRYLFQQHLLLDSNWLACRGVKRCLTGHEEGVYCLQFDRQKLVSGSRDNSIKVWDMGSGKCVRTIHGHDQSVLCLQYDLNNRLISGSSDAKIIEWNLETGEKIRELSGHRDSVLSLRFDDERIVSGSKDHTVIIWGRKSGQCQLIFKEHRAAVNAVALYRLLAVSASGDRLIKLWNIETGKCLRTLAGHQRGIACVQFDGHWIVSGSSDRSVRLWDASTGECLAVLEGHTDLVRTVEFNRRWIVSGSYDGTIRLWDIRAKRAFSELRNHTGRVFKLQFDHSTIASCSQDGRIAIYDFSRTAGVNGNYMQIDNRYF